MNQRKINENQQEWNRLAEKMLGVANTEMGIVKEDIAWLKEIVARLDSRTWTILATVLLGGVGILIQVLISIYSITHK